jgi:NitT/TauT family transport system substrate-binding protein
MDALMTTSRCVRRGLLPVGVLCGLLLLSGVATAADTLRMAVAPWIGYGPWWIAEATGLFEKYGLKVKLVNFNNEQDNNAALASKRIEVANVATQAFCIYRDVGLNIHAILLTDVSLTGDAVISRTATSLLELKGKRVAVEESSTSELLLVYGLASVGLRLSDVKTVFMPATDAGSAALANRVDAAVTFEPFLTAVILRDPSFKRIYSAAAKPGLISDVLVLRDDVAAADPSAAKKLLSVWDAALAFYRADPQTALKIMAKGVGSDPKNVEQSLHGLKFYSVAENQSMLTSGELQDALQTVSGIWKEQGKIRKPVVFEQAFEVSPLKGIGPSG